MKSLIKLQNSLKTSPRNNLETNEKILRKTYISPELTQKVIDDLRVMEDYY